MSNKKIVSTIQQQLQSAHEFLEATLEGVAAEHAAWTPPGRANPLGATYAHILLTEDGVLNGTIKGAAPLFASTWAGKVGISEPPPAPDPDNPALPDWAGWSRRVQVDLAALREYAGAVYAATDDYLASLTDADLDRSVDLSGLGLDPSTVGQLVGGIILSNVHWHTGEIACLKGLQGLKGYPV